MDELTLYNLEVKHHNLKDIANAIEDMTRNEIKEAIQEIYKCQLYCMHDLCDKEEPTASMCVDCFYDAIMKSIERKAE